MLPNCHWFRRAIVVACLIGVAGAGRAAAQQDATPTRAKLRENARETERTESQVVYPFALSGTPLTSAGLSAGEEDKTVFIKVGIRPKTKPMDLTFSASAPLDKANARTGVVQMNGLSNKTTFGAEMRWGYHRLPSGVENGAIFKVLMPNCEPLEKRTFDQMEQEVKDTGIREKGCSFEHLDDERLEQSLRPYRRTAMFVSLKGEAAPQHFAHLTADTFEKFDPLKWSSSGALTVGALLPNNTFFAGAFRVENAYEAAKDSALCEVPENAATVACPIKTVGGPASERAVVLELEGRRYLNKHAGIAAIVRHDWESDVTSLEVPLYFIQGKKSGLTGGVSNAYVWSDDEDERGYRAFLFVAQTFRLGQ